MSGRRGRPAGPTIPVGGQGDQLIPPTPMEEFIPLPDQEPPPGGYDPNILASTDPSEVPPPQLPPEGVEEGGKVVGDPPAPDEGVTELSPEEQVMFASLLTCGRRSKVIHLLDHTVVVQTLCADDDLRIGLFVKEYQGTLGEQRAYQVGVAAAGIRTIDGAPMVHTLYEQGSEDALFDAKVVKVSQMYPTVINRIYRAVMDAEKEFVELATKLGKLDG